MRSSTPLNQAAAMLKVSSHSDSDPQRYLRHTHGDSLLYKVIINNNFYSKNTFKIVLFKKVSEHSFLPHNLTKTFQSKCCSFFIVGL